MSVAGGKAAAASSCLAVVALLVPVLGYVMAGQPAVARPARAGGLFRCGGTISAKAARAQDGRLPGDEIPGYPGAG